MRKYQIRFELVYLVGLSEIDLRKARKGLVRTTSHADVLFCDVMEYEGIGWRQFLTVQCRYVQILLSFFVTLGQIERPTFPSLPINTEPSLSGLAKPRPERKPSNEKRKHPCLV